MKLGLLARACSSGLGSQTWELFRHLHPERTLIVDLSKTNGYPIHPERFPGARMVTFAKDRLEPASHVDWLLDGIDVLLTAETPYDWNLLTLARNRGVKTAVVYNMEFNRHPLNPTWPHPDLAIVPTTWRMDEMPGAVHIPHGVDRERLPFVKRTEAKTFLHVGGHPAMGDRSGTSLLLRAAQSVTTNVRLRMRAQGKGGFGTVRRHSRVSVEALTDDVENYYDLYEGADVLVSPRRYGGQHLPVNEALSLGMPVISLDRHPENEWGGVYTVPAFHERTLRAQSGPLMSHACRPTDLAKAIDTLALRPDLVAKLSEEADAHAATLDWSVTAPKYLAALSALL